MTCDGCLGKTTCGVCLGYGVYDVAKGQVVECHRCFGTGKCWICQDVTRKHRAEPPVLAAAFEAALGYEVATG
jgi:hypothetical protein